MQLPHSLLLTCWVHTRECKHEHTPGMTELDRASIQLRQTGLQALLHVVQELRHQASHTARLLGHTLSLHRAACVSLLAEVIAASAATDALSFGVGGGG